MRTRIRAAVLGVAISAAVLFGGSALIHQSAPAEASAVHVAATAVPVPASNAQPGAALKHRSQFEIPFYWSSGWNWNGTFGWCLFSDNGRALSCY